MWPRGNRQGTLRQRDRFALPSWSALCRSRPISAPGSRSSTRCAPPCSRCVSASSPGPRLRSSCDTYYVALLHASGCTSNGHEATQLYGDDIAHRAAFFLDRPDQPGGGARVLPGQRRRSAAARRFAPRLSRTPSPTPARGRARAFATMCEVAQRFAGWLELGPSIQAALEYVFARWDGRGFPDVGGDAIPLPMRLLHVARDISLFLSAAGPDEARAVIERRSGAAYDPRLADLATRNFDDLLAELDEARMWQQALEASRSRRSGSTGERIDAAFTAIAALTGLKSPWLREHSTAWPSSPRPPHGGWACPPASVTLLRRAALAHDLGRVGRVQRDLGEARAARVRGVGAGAAPSSLHGAGLCPVPGAHSDRDACRIKPRTARRLRLSPRHAWAGARSGGPHPCRRRLLRGHARGAAVPAGTRSTGGRGGADA